jgi:hypothetical protein
MADLNSITTLAREMARVQEEIDRLQEAKKQLQKLYDTLRFTDIPAAMDETGVDKLTLADIGTLYLAADVRAALYKDTKMEAYQWLQDNGYGDLIQPYVFPQTLKAWAKERLKAGDELPDMFAIEPYQMAKILKG